MPYHNFINVKTMNSSIMREKYDNFHLYTLPCTLKHHFYPQLFFAVFSLRQGFSVALEPLLELALVDQADLKITEIHLPLPPKCLD